MNQFKIMRKRIGLLSLVFLFVGSIFLAGVAPIAVHQANAACTDAQVDAWLSQRNLTRNDENLISAFRALGDCPQSEGITGLVSQIITILNYIIPFLIGLAVFLIIYGLLGYISSAADEERRKEARDFIIWGVIGVFCMMSVWGLVNILVKTFNLDTSNKVVIDRYGVARDAYGNIIQNPSTVLQGEPSTVIDLITRINIIGSFVIPFLISIAVFIIILGMVNYVRQGDNEEKRAEARMFILWGVISVFIMLSIWGLINILLKSFNINNQVPSLKTIFDNMRV